MKWTTANVKNPNYTQNHEIYVGTQTGSFKKLVPAYEDNPFIQRNLQDLSKLDKDSRITTLAFGNDEKSEILIGRAQNTVEVHSLRTDQVERCVKVQGAPVMGLARYDAQLVAGFANGTVQSVSMAAEDGYEAPQELFSVSAGDDIAHLRQCSTQRNFIATGGKGRQNNLKVYDIAAGGKQVFVSKNLPNDFLQLEVPVWDSDVGFIDAAHTLATCSRHGYVRVYDTRKQRRPVQCYANEDQMSFSTLVAHGNYIYTGTTMGALKAFDIRRMKNFVHTYKGFTGAISDLHLNDSGQFLVSASLDRYVRVHDANSCVLLYQCYVKSKVARVLIRDSLVTPKAEECSEAAASEPLSASKRKKSKAERSDVDEEYDDLFENMPTVCDNDEVEAEAEAEPEEDDTVAAVAGAEVEVDSTTKAQAATKRKNSTQSQKNKKKKN